MVTTAVADAIGESAYLEFDPIGQVELKGFPEPVELFVVRAREPDERLTEPRPARQESACARRTITSVMQGGRAWTSSPRRFGPAV